MSYLEIELQSRRRSTVRSSLARKLAEVAGEKIEKKPNGEFPRARNPLEGGGHGGITENDERTSDGGGRASGQVRADL